MKKVWIAEIWNTESQQWDILENLWFPNAQQSMDAVDEECQVEQGMIPAYNCTDVWEHDLEWNGWSRLWEFNGYEIPARVRKLEEGGYGE